MGSFDLVAEEEVEVSRAAAVLAAAEQAVSAARGAAAAARVPSSDHGLDGRGSPRGSGDVRASISGLSAGAGDGRPGGIAAPPNNPSNEDDAAPRNVRRHGTASGRLQVSLAGLASAGLLDSPAEGAHQEGFATTEGGARHDGRGGVGPQTLHHEPTRTMDSWGGGSWGDDDGGEGGPGQPPHTSVAGGGGGRLADIIRASATSLVSSSGSPRDGAIANAGCGANGEDGYIDGPSAGGAYGGANGGGYGGGGVGNTGNGGSGRQGGGGDGGIGGGYGYECGGDDDGRYENGEGNDGGGEGGGDYDGGAFGASEYKEDGVDRSLRASREQLAAVGHVVDHLQEKRDAHHRDPPKEARAALSSSIGPACATPGHGRCVRIEARDEGTCDLASACGGAYIPVGATCWECPTCPQGGWWACELCKKKTEPRSSLL
jgi:hypothetical protein